MEGAEPAHRAAGLRAYCDPAHHKAVRKAMEAYRELPIALDPDGSKIIFQNRAGYRMASV